MSVIVLGIASRMIFNYMKVKKAIIDAEDETGQENQPDNAWRKICEHILTYFKKWLSDSTYIDFKHWSKYQFAFIFFQVSFKDLFFQPFCIFYIKVWKREKNLEFCTYLA